MRNFFLKLTLWLIAQIGLFVATTAIFNGVGHLLGKEFDIWIDVALLKFFIMMFVDDDNFISIIGFFLIVICGLLVIIFPSFIFDQLKIKR